MTHILNRLLGFPPSIDFSKIKPSDNVHPEVVIHERNIPASIVSSMIALMIFLLVTQSQFLHNASTVVDTCFDNLADFMSEAPLITMLIHAIGFALSVLIWIVPTVLFVIAVARTGFELFPSWKNPRDPDTAG